MKRAYVVIIDQKPEQEDQDVLSFIREELGSAGGYKDPLDPFFHSLKVLEVKPEARRVRSKQKR